MKHKNIYTKELIRKYNEEIHVGSGLTGDDLYTLDESEIEDFEKWCKKELLKGKFVVAYDTICDGNQCMMERNEQDEVVGPLLFDSEDEAIKEIFDGNYEMLKSHMEEEMLDEYNEGVTPEMISEMGEILQSDDATRMKEFMDSHPECNDSGEWVQPAEEFIMNRKTFIGAEGGYITGKKLNEI
jgi:hypothetical protein